METEQWEDSLQLTLQLSDSNVVYTQWCDRADAKRPIQSTLQAPIHVSRREGENEFALVDTWIRVNDPSAGSPTERWIICMLLKFRVWLAFVSQSARLYLKQSLACHDSRITHCYLSLWTASWTQMKSIGLGCWLSIVTSLLDFNHTLSD